MAKSGESGQRIIGASVVRNKKVTTWVSAEEYAFLGQAAKNAGLPLSSYVRASSLALAKIQRQKAGATVWDAGGGSG